jgi:hypothetical protein
VNARPLSRPALAGLLGLPFPRTSRTTTPAPRRSAPARLSRERSGNNASGNGGRRASCHPSGCWCVGPAPTGIPANLRNSDIASARRVSPFRICRSYRFTIDLRITRRKIGLSGFGRPRLAFGQSQPQPPSRSHLSPQVAASAGPEDAENWELPKEVELRWQVKPGHRRTSSPSSHPCPDSLGSCGFLPGSNPGIPTKSDLANAIHLG